MWLQCWSKELSLLLGTTSPGKLLCKKPAARTCSAVLVLWYDRGSVKDEAALNGHAAAPVQLGNVYFDKANPAADNAKAHFWWTIAERRNAPGAGENLYKLERTMSKEDKQRAAAYLDQCAKATLRNCFPRTP